MVPDQRDLIEPGHFVFPALSLRLPIDDAPMLGPRLLPSLQCHPRARCKKKSPESSRLGGS
jgi:hypothetical protein